MTNPKITRVYITTDEEGHWYVIPYDMKDEFLSKLCYDVEEFEVVFSKYRTGGDINNVSLFILENY